MTFAAEGSPAAPSLGASSRQPPKQSTCPARQELNGWKRPAAQISTKPHNSPLESIRSQRNRLLLERVANQIEAREPAGSSPRSHQLPRGSFACAARKPVAAIDNQARNSRQLAALQLAKENTSQRVALARLSATCASREVRAQPQDSPEKSRLRQGALFGRRHQIRLTARVEAPPSGLANCRALERNRPKLISCSNPPAVNQNSRYQSLTRISLAPLQVKGPARQPELSRKSLPASLRDFAAGGRCESSARQLAHAKSPAPAPKGRTRGAPVASSETKSQPKTNKSPRKQADQSNIRAPQKSPQTFVIDKNAKVELARAISGARSESKVGPAARNAEIPREESPSEGENKIDNSNQPNAPGERMRPEEEQENSQTLSLSLEANNMQRSRSSLGSSRNSLESSSPDEQMVFGSPLISRDNLLVVENNRLEVVGLPTADLEKKEPSLVSNPSEGFKQQSKKQKKSTIQDISIRQDSIGDFYELESRPFARGKFAQVKRCVHKETRQCFAAKCIKKRHRLVDIRHEILMEIEALKLSYHTDRIIKLYEVFETTNEIILILEMANGGELQRVLDDEESISEGIVKKMVRQILEALVELHENDIAHLDIKPQNLLLTEPFPDGDIKLCDFGISRRITKDCEIRDICGTSDYVAPEILRYDPISLATDMWSLGVLIYVLLSGYSPFGSDNKQQTFCNITQATLDFPSELFDENEVSKDAIDFIGKLIVREPKERLTSKQARNHSWLSNE